MSVKVLPEWPSLLLAPRQCLEWLPAIAPIAPLFSPDLDVEHTELFKIFRLLEWILNFLLNILVSFPTSTAGHNEEGEIFNPAGSERPKRTEAGRSVRTCGNLGASVARLSVCKPCKTDVGTLS